MDDAAILPARHRLDVDAYHRMGEAGIFGENTRIELIDGELIDMAPIGQGHASTVNRLTQSLVLTCNRRAIVSVQNPVRLGRYSEPQPDIVILRNRPDFYGTGEPAGPADVLLLIEVADSSLAFDRTVKLSLYARAGIPEYWIINLKHRTGEVHQQPSDTGYLQTTTAGPGARLQLAAAPEITVALDEILS